MSGEDFESAIRPKVDGSLHLQKVFQGPSLDFFVMLSSLASVLGPRSQANYAAGNAFQDELAYTQSQSETHYISLNLGLIEDSEIIVSNPDMRRNAVRAGCIPLRLSELFSLLEYAMSTQAREDRVHQIAIGLDRQSLLGSHRPALLDSPLFSHLAYCVDERDTQRKAGPMEAVDKAIAAATTLDEVQNIMTTAIARQTSSLLAIDVDTIDPDSPMENLGLDSLIAIELKAWIARTLRAGLQTSEIMDTPTIRALAKVAAKRSNLVTMQQIELAADHDTKQNEVTLSVDHEHLPMQLPNPTVLPSPPIPDLESTLGIYIYSMRAFCSKDELENLSKAIQEFVTPGGFGQLLRQRLLERTRDPQIDSWLADLYNRHVYLKHREPVNPWQHFFGCHAASKIPHGQAERAAIICKAAFSFKKHLEAGAVGPDYLNEQPLCMNTLNWLFNSIREPRIGVDSMQKFPGYDYLVAMRKGHFFKVPLSRHNKPISILSLKATFRTIIDQPLIEAPAFGILTADNRDSWAKVSTRSFGLLCCIT